MGQKFIANIDTEGVLPVGATMVVYPANPFFNGNRFKAMLDAVKHQIGTNLTIVLADTLMAHMLALGAVDVEEMRDDARRRGSRWLGAHALMLEEFYGSNDYKILRWDDLMAEKSFTKKSNILTKLYRNNRFVRQRIQTMEKQMVEEHAEDKVINGHTQPRDVLVGIGADYMVEKIAGLSMVQDMVGYPEIAAKSLVKEQDAFSKHNTLDESVSLDLPDVFKTSMTRLSGADKSVAHSRYRHHLQKAAG